MRHACLDAAEKATLEGEGNNMSNMQRGVSAAVRWGACFALAATAASAGTALKFNDPADIAAIKALENRIQSATRMEPIVDDYAQNAFVADYVAPGIYQGKKAIFAGFQHQLLTTKTIVATIPDIEIASDGTLACAILQPHFDTTLKTGQSFSLTLREFDAFRKSGGKWRIIEQQVSAPMDPKTGKTVTDDSLPPLKPITWPADAIAGPATTPQQGKQELRAWLDAGKDMVDVDQMMHYFVSTDDLLVYDILYPGLAQGVKGVHDYYQPLMQDMASLEAQVGPLANDSDGTMGVQIHTLNITVKNKHGSGAPTHMTLRESDCLRRVNGKWHSFLEMTSFPADAATGKAVTIDPHWHP
jgi:ketosteroid isomerase-like protein